MAGKSKRSPRHGDARSQGRARGRGGRVENGRGPVSSGRSGHAGDRRSGRPGNSSERKGSRTAQAGNRSGRAGNQRAFNGARTDHDRFSPNRGAAPRATDTYIEGRRAAAEALRSGFPVKRALIAQDAQADENLARIVYDLRSAGVPFKEVPRAQLDRISSHGAHQGIVLETAPFPYASLEDIIQRAGTGAALVVVLDHVTDEGNFGAIVRSAEVVGAAGVVIASKRAAAVGVGAYKTSAGAVMHLPIAQVPNLPAAVERLKEAGFWVGGSSEHARQGVWDAPLTGRIALVMGSEGTGISRLMLEKCDFLVKLPQRGLTESLNVAQAATVMCYEWLRANQDELLGEKNAPAPVAAQGNDAADAQGEKNAPAADVAEGPAAPGAASARAGA